MDTEYGREVVRCGHCQLRQFQTKTHHCRKCGKRMEPEPEPEPPAPVEEKREKKPSKPRPEELFHLTVGSIMIKLRNSMGLTQAALACRMGVPRSYISKLETNQIQPYASNRILLAWALEVEPEIFSLSPEMDKAKLEERIMGDPFLMEMHEHSQHLCEEQRHLVIEAARSMAKGQGFILDWLELS